jgi:hypothetical protein
MPNNPDHLANPPASTASCRRPAWEGRALAVSAATVTDHVCDSWHREPTPNPDFRGTGAALRQRPGIHVISALTDRRKPGRWLCRDAWKAQLHPLREILTGMPHESVEIVRGARIALPRLSERATQRRSLDQRLYVRFPALYRMLADSVMRLSSRSRLRRLLLARSVGLAYAAANRRDFDLVLLGWDPGSEYHPSGDLLPPDLETVFYGHDGYLRLWRYWLDAFEDIRWDPEEILDFGDRFLVTTQQWGRGSGSGVAVSEPVFQLFTVRRGLVVRQEDFLDRSKALEAAARRE